jgi:hypothetical protein
MVMNMLEWIFIALVAGTLLLIWRNLNGRRRTLALWGTLVASAGLTIAVLAVESVLTA